MELNTLPNLKNNDLHHDAHKEAGNKTDSSLTTLKDDIFIFYFDSSS
jgi:hypothetical protein